MWCRVRTYQRSLLLSVVLINDGDDDYDDGDDDDGDDDADNDDGGSAKSQAQNLSNFSSHNTMWQCGRRTPWF